MCTVISFPNRYSVLRNVVLQVCNCLAPHKCPETIWHHTHPSVLGNLSARPHTPCLLSHPFFCFWSLASPARYSLASSVNLTFPILPQLPQEKKLLLFVTMCSLSFSCHRILSNSPGVSRGSLSKSLLRLAPTPTPAPNRQVLSTACSPLSCSALS